MKLLPLFPRLLGCLLLAGSAVRAELPRYTVTKVKDYFPALGPLGDPVGPNYTFVWGVSAGGSNYMASFLDRVDPFNGGDDKETHFVVDSQTLAPILQAAPPPGYETGTSGALYSSGAGHLVYSVSTAGDRGTPGWIDRIQVARANPDGTTTVLPAVGIEQRGVNASGMVIGDGPDTTSAWRYTDAGGWKNLGSLNASGYAQPKAINDAGTVVGRSSSADGYFTPFLYTDSGGMQTFTDGTGNELFGEATAINNNGLIAGTANGRAFVFNGSTMEFTFLTPEVDQKVVDINSAGVLLGVFYTPPILGFIPGNLGWIATKDDGFNLLENLILQDITDPEWRINESTDINDDGWILATGYNFRDNKTYQVLLQPVPEPGTALMCVAAGLAVLQRRRRR